jgi:hypothetical protein
VASTVIGRLSLPLRVSRFISQLHRADVVLHVNGRRVFPLDPDTDDRWWHRMRAIIATRTEALGGSIERDFEPTVIADDDHRVRTIIR